MKFIQKSRLETFLKTKGFEIDISIKPEEELSYSAIWSKEENEKVKIPKKDIFQSSELPLIFSDKSLLNEFRKF